MDIGLGKFEPHRYHAEYMYIRIKLDSRLSGLEETVGL